MPTTIKQNLRFWSGMIFIHASALLVGLALIGYAMRLMDA